MTSTLAPSDDSASQHIGDRADLPPLRRKRVTRAFAAAALAAALLASAACSSSGSSSSTSSGTADSTTAAAGGTAGAPAELTKALQPTTSYAALASIPGGVGALKGKTVWWVPFGAVLPYMQSVGAGIKSALDMVGAKMHTCDGKLIPTAMASCMDDAASQHAAAVIGGYIDYTLIPNAFDNLVAKHIPVLVGGAPPGGGKTSSPKLAFYDMIDTQTTLARWMAEKVIADSSGKAKILFIGSSDTPELVSISNYSKSYYKQHCPKCSLDEISYSAATASKLGSQVSAALISHPSVNYAIMQFDPAAASVVNAIQTAGKTGSIKFLAQGGGLDSLQRVAAGRSQVVDVGSSGYYTGWLFVDGVARMLAGMTPTPSKAVGRVFVKDGAKSVSLTPSAYASNAWYGDNSYRQTFAKAWGLAG